MTQSKLHIIIVGSGLAGLAAASVLREHHNVTIYERGGPDVATGGQGMCIFPNGVKILQSVGFDNDRVGGVPCHGYRSFDKSGKLVDDFPIDFKDRWGADMIMMKRSDFRAELLRLATAHASEPNVKGDPARVVFDTVVEDVDPEAGSVTLKDGSLVHGDVVIVADGIHSTLRHRVTGDKNHVPKKSGLSLFRIAVSAEDVKKALGHLPDWWDVHRADNRLNVMQPDDGTHRALAYYPIRNHEYKNFSCLFPMREGRGSIVESWYTDGDRKDMLDTFNDFDPTVREILSVASEVKLWDLQDIDPLPNWHRGRALLLGDAAHAMTPLQGQGANMGMEDADSLRLLRPGMGLAEIQSTLEKIDSVRRPRAARVLKDTREQAKITTMEERLARMDYNCRYGGIYEALKEADMAVDSR